MPLVISKADRKLVYRALFKDGVLVAKKNIVIQHRALGIHNLTVLNLMKSLKSRGYVTETFAWRHYYWYLTTEGIEYLRTYLYLPEKLVPDTMAAKEAPKPVYAVDKKKAGVDGDYNPKFRRQARA